MCLKPCLLGRLAVHCHMSSCRHVAMRCHMISLVTVVAAHATLNCPLSDYAKLLYSSCLLTDDNYKVQQLVETRRAVVHCRTGASPQKA